ncbi:hypothetical protein V6582_06430 [Agrobacterium vitis]|uniref:hypothetical protein n=1 Tax=Agrobacterium vitis TaxID=373 RepID=UPI001327A04C|nr:hypothetical protein [Agrobacterium vitis]MVA25974.1 hypothetical protein [Agrobacterium vitis]
MDTSGILFNLVILACAGQRIKAQALDIIDLCVPAPHLPVTCDDRRNKSNLRFMPHASEKRGQ